eukprot:6961246-Heterocapsa_arctica.AAC.1
MMSRWGREEPAHDADKQEEETGSQAMQGMAQAEEDMQEPQVRTLSTQQQTIENDIENIVGYWRWNKKGAWKTGIQKAQI